MRFSLIASLCFVLFGGDSKASEGKISFSTTIQNSEACRQILSQFDWFCLYVERRATRIGDGKSIMPELDDFPYWELVGLRVAKLDLDGDGLLDVIAHDQNEGYCGPAGCPFRFIFGGHPHYLCGHANSVWGQDDPTLVEKNGQRHLSFDGGAKMILIDALKSETRARLRRVDEWMRKRERKNTCRAEK